MAVLEVETFSLKPEIDALAFRALDEAMQEWCYVNRAGLALLQGCCGFHG